MMSYRTTSASFVVLLIVFLLSWSNAVQAVSVASSIMDDNGEWTLGTTSTSFLTGTVTGITPTAGTDTMHFLSDDTGPFSGTNFIVFTHQLAVGTYTTTIDVGNYDNFGFPPISFIGMTVGGAQPVTVGTGLSASAGSFPVPPSGTIREWSITYDILPGNPQLGSAIGFAITVPTTNIARNVAFDNLNIDFVAAPSSVPEPITATLGLMGLGVLGMAARRRVA